MSQVNEILEGIEADASTLGVEALGDDIRRHAAALAAAGAAPSKVIDEALLLLLHRGESHAVRSGAGLGDPLGVRPVALKYADYHTRLRAESSRIPDELRNRRRNMQCMVTRVCNLRCGYCPATKRDAWMDDGVLSSALSFLLSSDEKNLRLDFSGGEPLYRFDSVARVCRDGLRAAGASGKNLTFYMVTNGTLLDGKAAGELKALPILLEISLDGKEEDHNRFKTPVDASFNPYRATRRAIDLLLEKSVDFYIVMVATPETAGHIEENFDHIVSLGVRSVDINYAIGRLWSQESLGIYLEGVSAVLRKYGPRIESGKMKLGNIGRKVEPSILNAEWMVDTDGSVHLMTEWVFQSFFPYDPGAFSHGNVSSLAGFGALYADRFHAYLTLLRSAGWRDEGKRKIIHNNIEAGRRVGKFFGKFAGGVKR